MIRQKEYKAQLQVDFELRTNELRRWCSNHSKATTAVLQLDLKYTYLYWFAVKPISKFLVQKTTNTFSKNMSIFCKKDISTKKCPRSFFPLKSFSQFCFSLRENASQIFHSAYVYSQRIPEARCAIYHSKSGSTSLSWVSGLNTLNLDQQTVLAGLNKSNNLFG